MPIPQAPALPKRWDRTEIPAQKVAQQNIKDLQTRAKFGRREGLAAKRAADLAMQKLGNFLLFDAKKNDSKKVEQAEAIKPTVIELYEDALRLSAALSSPSGEFTVKMIKQSKPKFWHNANAAGKKPKWTFEYADTGLESINGKFDITMDRSRGEESDQAKWFSDQAIAQVEKITGATVVKVVGKVE
jgi:hypothetical protein